MDPATTLLSILLSLEDVAHLKDKATIDLCKADAAEACANLSAWLRSGGFTPDVQEVTREYLGKLDCVVLSKEEINAVAEICEEYSPKSAAEVRGLAGDLSSFCTP